MLIHIINQNDGSVFSKAKITGGFGDSLDYNSHYLCSVIISGIGYTAPTSSEFYYSLTSFNSKIKLTGGFSDTEEISTIEFSHEYNTYLPLFLSKSSSITFEQITDAEYDPTTQVFTPGAEVTLANVANTSLTVTSQSLSVESSENMTLNIWSSEVSQSIEGDSTGGSFTPEYTCVSVTSGLTAPTAVYSLVDGSGSVPNWVSVDSSTAEISYEAPPAEGTYSFDLRTQFNEDSSLNYDRTITITVGAGGDAGGGAENPESNSSSESEESGCLGSSSKAGCGGVVAAVVVGVLVISIGGVVVVVVIIVKVFVGGGTQAFAVVSSAGATASAIQPPPANIFAGETKV